MARDLTVRVYDAVSPGALRPHIDVHSLDRSHPRVHVGKHAHQDLEIVYFRSGQGTHRVGSKTWPLAAGDLFLIPPGQPHDLSQMGDAEGWALEFAPSAMAAVPELAGSIRLWRSNPMLSPFVTSERHPEASRVSVPAHRRAVLEGLFVDMQRELEERGAGYRTASAAQVLLLLVNVARLASDVAGQYRLSNEPALAACFEAIEKGFRGPLSSSDVARMVSVSPSHLSSLVKQRTGRTVLDWITERRMAEARQLLMTTDFPVEVVGQRVGFADPAYFSRRFRQVHGQAPAAWRRTVSEA